MENKLRKIAQQHKIATRNTIGKFLSSPLGATLAGGLVGGTAGGLLLGKDYILPGSLIGGAGGLVASGIHSGLPKMEGGKQYKDPREAKVKEDESWDPTKGKTYTLKNGTKGFVYAPKMDTRKAPVFGDKAVMYPFASSLPFSAAAAATAPISGPVAAGVSALTGITYAGIKLTGTDKKLDDLWNNRSILTYTNDKEKESLVDSLKQLGMFKDAVPTVKHWRDNATGKEMTVTGYEVR